MNALVYVGIEAWLRSMSPPSTNVMRGNRTHIASRVLIIMSVRLYLAPPVGIHALSARIANMLIKSCLSYPFFYFLFSSDSYIALDGGFFF